VPRDQQRQLHDGDRVLVGTVEFDCVLEIADVRDAASDRKAKKAKKAAAAVVKAERRRQNQAEKKAESGGGKNQAKAAAEAKAADQREEDWEGIHLFAELSALAAASSETVAPEDYYDDETAAWDLEALRDDIRLSRRPAAQVPSLRFAGARQSDLTQVARDASQQESAGSLGAPSGLALPTPSPSIEYVDRRTLVWRCLDLDSKAGSRSWAITGFSVQVRLHDSTVWVMLERTHSRATSLKLQKQRGLERRVPIQFRVAAHTTHANGPEVLGAYSQPSASVTLDRRFAEDSAAEPFGLDQFLSEAKQGKALAKIGEGAGMAASAGSSIRWPAAQLPSHTSPPQPPPPHQLPSPPQQQPLFGSPAQQHAQLTPETGAAVIKPLPAAAATVERPRPQPDLAQVAREAAAKGHAVAALQSRLSNLAAALASHLQHGRS
jgi:hypothetical protein